MSTTLARAAARTYLRDFVTDGVAASGENDPVKAEGRTAFERMADAIDTAQGVADSAAAGLAWTDPVRVRSNGNVVIASGLENGDTLNGVTLATGDRVFLGSQTAPAENGVYVVPASGAATRATDADTAGELARIAFAVLDGTAGAGEQWMLPLGAASITVGTTALDFVQIGGELDMAAQFEARLQAVETPLRVFRDTVTDPVLTETVIEARIIGAWDYEDFYLNAQFYDHLTGPFNKWVKLNLHDASGDIVAQWSKINVDPGAEDEWVFLTNVANGSVQTPYQGIVAALRIDWAAVTALGWNDNLTTHTTTAAAGIRQDLNRPPEALLAFLGEMAPEQTLTVGTEGEYATVNAAVEDLWINDTTTISRSTFPNSDLANPGRLVQIRVVDDSLDEAITPRTISLIQNGLCLPAWSELYLPAGARLKMAAGGDAPVLEANMPVRLRGGGVIENLGEGYGLHVDPDNLARRAANGPAVLRYFGVWLIEDMDFIVHGTTGTAIAVAGAFGNGMRIVFRRCSFRRGAGTGPLFAFHTTPDTTDAGELGFDACYFDPTFVAAQFIKKHATPTGLRHKIWFRDCEGGAIQYSDPDAIGGTVPFVRAGTISGFASVAAELDPA